MEVFDFSSGAVGVLFLAMLINVVLLGWRNTPEQMTPVHRRRDENSADKSNAA